MLPELAVDGLAVARITRLITTDTIFDRPRAHVIGALHAAGYETAVEGLLCDWCTAVWVTAAVCGLRAVAPRLWGRAAYGLAAAQIAGSLLSAVR